MAAMSVGQMRQAVVYDVSHRTENAAALRHRASLEELHEAVLGPGLRERRGRDVGRIETVDLGASQLCLALDRAHDVARRVAIGAVRQRLDQIGAAVPFVALAGHRLELGRRKEQLAPGEQAQPDVERKRQPVFRPGRIHRGDAPHIGPQCLEIVVLDSGIGVERHRRIEIGPIRADAVVKRLLELRVGPFADSGRGIGRDVDGIERAERRVGGRPPA
jgi:hypothetical protein